MSIAATIERLSQPLAPIPSEVEPVLKPLAGVRALLFDIYGTLLISDSGDVGTALENSRDDALAAALAAVGLRPSPPPAARELIQMIKTRQERARARGVESPEVDIREVWRELLSGLGEGGEELIARLGIEYECRVNQVWPMPGWRDCLRRIADSGRALGIVSNAQYYTPLIMQTLMPGYPAGLGFEEDLIVYSYQVLQSKPARTIFARPLRGLAARGISPRETVYVGNDMLNDIQTAAALGMRTVLFAGDRRSLRLRRDDPRCEGIEPDAVATELDQIADILV